MARKPARDEGPGGAPEWMTTYSDLVTLLLCFFVMLYASSNVDAEKIQAIGQSFSNANRLGITASSEIGISTMLGAGITQMPTPTNASEAQEKYKKNQQELREMASQFKTYFAENELSDKVEVQVEDTFISLSFTDGILFDKGKAELKDSAINALNFIGDELVGSPGTEIKIEGHTDSDPINTVKYADNWYLSAARAISVGKYFIDTKGIDPVRIGTEGFGEYRPIAPNDTEENKTKNRRVEIKVMSGALTSNTQ